MPAVSASATPRHSRVYLAEYGGNVLCIGSCAGARPNPRTLKPYRGRKAKRIAGVWPVALGCASRFLHSADFRFGIAEIEELPGGFHRGNVEAARNIMAEIAWARAYELIPGDRPSPRHVGNRTATIGYCAWDRDPLGIAMKAARIGLDGVYAVPARLLRATRRGDTIVYLTDDRLSADQQDWVRSEGATIVTEEQFTTPPLTGRNSPQRAKAS